MELVGDDGLRPLIDVDVLDDLLVRALQLVDRCCQSNANRSPLDAMILNFAIL